MTAGRSIVRIADVAQRAHTFALRACGSRATSDAVAQVATAATLAIVSARTGVCRAARAVQRIVTVVGDWCAHRKRIAQAGRRAFAIVTAWCVDAHRIRAARILETFIDVTATDEGIAGETDGTHTFDASIDLSTLGTGSALRLGARVLCLCATNFVWIAQSARIADALVRYDAVATMCIFTASRFA